MPGEPHATSRAVSASSTGNTAWVEAKVCGAANQLWWDSHVYKPAVTSGMPCSNCGCLLCHCDKPGCTSCEEHTPGYFWATECSPDQVHPRTAWCQVVHPPLPSARAGCCSPLTPTGCDIPTCCVPRGEEGRDDIGQPPFPWHQWNISTWPWYIPEAD